MRKRGAEGEQFKLQSRGMETFNEDKKVCTEEAATGTGKGAK